MSQDFKSPATFFLSTINTDITAPEIFLFKLLYKLNLRENPHYYYSLIVNAHRSSRSLRPMLKQHSSGKIFFLGSVCNWVGCHEVLRSCLTSEAMASFPFNFQDSYSPIQGIVVRRHSWAFHDTHISFDGSKLPEFFGSCGSSCFDSRSRKSLFSVSNDFISTFLDMIYLFQEMRW